MQKTQDKLSARRAIQDAKRDHNVDNIDPGVKGRKELSGVEVHKGIRSNDQPVYWEGQSILSGDDKDVVAGE